MEVEQSPQDAEQDLAQGLQANLNLGGGENSGPGPSSTIAQSGTGTPGSEVESTAIVRFSPPVGIQRYMTIRKVLDEFLEKADPDQLKSILEVGCAQLRLHTYMKTLHGSVQKIVYMDIDQFLLENVS